MTRTKGHGHGSQASALKAGYVTEKQGASVLKGAGLMSTEASQVSFVTSSSSGGSSSASARAPASAALGSSMAYYTGQLMSRTYTVTMQFKNSNEALTRFAQQIVGRPHARISKIYDFVKSTAVVATGGRASLIVVEIYGSSCPRPLLGAALLGGSASPVYFF